MIKDKNSQAVEPAGQEKPGPANSPRRILVADDEPSVRHLITASLTQSGYHVDAAEDGAAAWEALQATKYDLLITDNVMPKITGIELVKNMRCAHIGLPVVLVSGSVPTEDLEHDPEFELCAVLPKPFALDVLLATVRDVLRASVSRRLDTESNGPTLSGT